MSPDEARARLTMYATFGIGNPRLLAQAREVLAQEARSGVEVVFGVSDRVGGTDPEQHRTDCPGYYRESAGCDCAEGDARQDAVEIGAVDAEAA